MISTRPALPLPTAHALPLHVPSRSPQIVPTYLQEHLRSVPRTTLISANSGRTTIPTLAAKT